MGTHPIFESDFDCLTENLTARSYPGVVRYATYSANPIAKTGTIDDLVHNDALRRGHNAPRLASGWKVDRSAKVANEPFPLPDHKYVFQAMAVPIFTYRNVVVKVVILVAMLVNPFS